MAPLGSGVGSILNFTPEVKHWTFCSCKNVNFRIQPHNTPQVTLEGIGDMCAPSYDINTMVIPAKYWCRISYQILTRVKKYVKIPVWNTKMECKAIKSNNMDSFLCKQYYGCYIIDEMSILGWKREQLKSWRSFSGMYVWRVPSFISAVNWSTLFDTEAQLKQWNVYAKPPKENMLLFTIAIWHVLNTMLSIDIIL